LLCSFFFSCRRRHTRFSRDWSSDVCSSDLADPNEMPVMEIAALNGRVEPQVDAAEADFNTLGVQMRGYSDVGVARQEPRGGVYRSEERRAGREGGCRWWRAHAAGSGGTAKV